MKLIHAVLLIMAGKSAAQVRCALSDKLSKHTLSREFGVSSRP
jgi:hypothetical protein